jgi:hypothetical protein
MTREIKFRAWDKSRKIMIDNPGDIPGDLQVSFINNSFVNSDYDFMQFTGLHDKNGKEIYEGDIIVYGGLLRKKIKWEISEDVEYPDNNNVGFYIPKECEVIGNIYQNFGLLK